MLQSALMNVMIKAARRAGRSLKRDLGEVENLQVSLKGPANFVTMADKRAEEILYTDLLKARPSTADTSSKAKPSMCSPIPEIAYRLAEAVNTLGGSLSQRRGTRMSATVAICTLPAAVAE